MSVQSLALPHQWAPNVPTPQTSRVELRGPAGVLNLTRYVRASGTTLLKGASGFGLPEVDVHWWEGAADGAHYRDTRVKARTVSLPMEVHGPSQVACQAILDGIAATFAPSNEPAVLRVVEPSGMGWDLSVVRTGGSDWQRGQSTNGWSWVKFALEVTAGDPYWTRVQTASATVGANVGRGLLGPAATSLTQLRLSAGGSSAFGTVTLQNPGTAPAYPVITIAGPVTSLDLASQGVGLSWSGTLADGETLIFDAQAGTVTDGTGANRYAELGAAPRFWRVPPGSTQATVQLNGIDPQVSHALLAWRPRRWLVL